MKTQQNLHRQFVEIGRRKNRLSYQLQYLLPGIYKAQIFKKYCRNIFEYAGKFGGMSRGVVLKTLRLEENLKNKPFLKESVRRYGVHKVSLVASLATAESDKIFSEYVRNLSKSALEELAKELRDFEKEKLLGGEQKKIKKTQNLNLFKNSDKFDGFKNSQIINADQEFNKTQNLNLFKCLPGDNRSSLKKDYRDKKKSAYGKSKKIEESKITKDELKVIKNLKSKPCRARGTKIKLELNEDQSFIFMKFKKYLESSEKRIKDFNNPTTDKKFLNNQEVLEKLSEMMELEMEKYEKFMKTKNFKRVENREKTKRFKKVQKTEKVQSITGDGESLSRNSQKKGQKPTCKRTKKVEGSQISRYLPVKLKREALQKTEGKCCYPNCNRPAEHFHHRVPFAELKNLKNLKSRNSQDSGNGQDSAKISQLLNANIHQSIVPICQLHHQFAHAGLITDQSRNPQHWQLNLQKPKLSKIDQQYLEIKSGL